ncbi:MAG: RNA-binding transcriptional accessory protein [Bacteroidales bacterium]|nr:RNA-binding transcriptional accessory protein [Bacteroidales bacterium]
MENKYIHVLAMELNLLPWQVENTMKLLNAGATIPFISRYRKEATGSLDEVQVGNIRDLFNKYQELEKRREAIIKSIDEQGKLTEELRKRLDEAMTLTELEDIYLPYKPKRKTRASVAREKGLEPLADILFRQTEKDISGAAAQYLNDQVETVEDALQGARDIIAERINEDQQSRNLVRRQFSQGAIIASKIIKGKEEEGIKYKDYFDFAEPLNRCPSHRLMAMLRGEDEGFLRVSIEPDAEKAVTQLNRQFIRGAGDGSNQVTLAIKDSYKRLLSPSIETEFRALSKEKADMQAIGVFAGNLKQLLMSPPLGQKRVLAIDPGFRSGCKVVCLDAQGNLLHNETIFPHPPQQETTQAIKKIGTLVNAYKIEAIAIGNGTASRETEAFIRKIKFERDLKVFVVSEAGASVYSASKTARDEFPDYDVTVRGAVSIGRRLMDPLAELVKIDPKSIGVGQYQHDVDQHKLKESLDQVVESCVNAVGVDLNTASMHLLTYVSGLGLQLAKNIVDYRKEQGEFTTREDLKKIPRMGPKAFEQAAGFLRIRNGRHPLDNSAVHPESYYLVEKMAKDLGHPVDDLLKDESLRKQLDINRYIDEKAGLPTLTDIMNELAKPGRDPRSAIKVFEFADDIHTIEDVQPGMVLPGIVTNITNFGAFVDIGVKQDGLVHISQLADRFVTNPADVVKLHQHVKVKVVEVDLARKRIQLTMKNVK